MIVSPLGHGRVVAAVAEQDVDAVVAGHRLVERVAGEVDRRGVVHVVGRHDLDLGAGRQNAGGNRHDGVAAALSGRLALAARDRELLPEVDGFWTAVEAGIEAMVREALAPSGEPDQLIRVAIALVSFPS